MVLLGTSDAHGDLMPPPDIIGNGTIKLPIIIYLTALASKLTEWAAFVWLDLPVPAWLARLDQRVHPDPCLPNIRKQFFHNKSVICKVRKSGNTKLKIT